MRRPIIDKPKTLRLTRMNSDIYEEMQARVNDTEIYIGTFNSRPPWMTRRQNRSVDSALIGAAYAISNSNVFVDTIIRGPTNRFGTPIYLEELDALLTCNSGSNTFVFKKVYKLHTTNNRSWNSTDELDQLYSKVFQPFQNKHRSNSGNRVPTEVVEGRQGQKVARKVRETLQKRAQGTSPHDGKKLVVTLSGKIPNFSMFGVRRSQSDWNSFVRTYDLQLSNLYNYREEVSKDVVTYELGAQNPTSIYNPRIKGRIEVFSADTPVEGLTIPLSEESRWAQKTFGISDEQLYMGWLPDAEELSHTITFQGWALYKRPDLQPNVINGKTLEDLVKDSQIHVTTPIEVYCLESNKSIRLEEGVYQPFYPQEGGSLFDGNLTRYNSDSLAFLNTLRAIFPSGRLQALRPAGDDQAVITSNISKRGLTLPSEAKVTTFHQRSKNI